VTDATNTKEFDKKDNCGKAYQDVFHRENCL
jgi:hypothetical protein